MDSNHILKQAIYDHLVNLLNDKIDSANQSIASTKESRDNNTKSSAGDKHETARAMMQIEMENNQKQLNLNLALKKELSKINLERKYSFADFGSLVITNQGNYFIAIGIGKVEIENKAHYSISLASPIGNLLQNKVKGDVVKFQEREIEILDVI